MRDVNDDDDDDDDDNNNINNNNNNDNNNNNNNNNFMAPFYGWGSTISKLQKHYEEKVHFLPLSSHKFLVLI